MTNVQTHGCAVMKRLQLTTFLKTMKTIGVAIDSPKNKQSEVIKEIDSETQIRFDTHVQK